MILEAGRIIAGYPFVARRHGRVPLCDVVAVTACFERAAELARAPGDEPAAVFFALAAKRQAFPFAWKLMARLVARTQATAIGLVLGASEDELDTLCVEVFYERVTWPAVVEWFRARLRRAAP